MTNILSIRKVFYSKYTTLDWVVNGILYNVQIRYWDHEDWDLSEIEVYCDDTNTTEPVDNDTYAEVEKSLENDNKFIDAVAEEILTIATEAIEEKSGW